MGAVTDKIKNVIRKQGYRPTFYTKCSVASFLSNNRVKTDKIKKSGIYKLKCADCNAVYVGQTGRSFDARCKIHTRITSNNISKSNFANQSINGSIYLQFHVYKQRLQKNSFFVSPRLYGHFFPAIQ